MQASSCIFPNSVGATNETLRSICYFDAEHSSNLQKAYTHRISLNVSHYLHQDINISSRLSVYCYHKTYTLSILFSWLVCFRLAISDIRLK
jgi:hypothetical protein